MSTAAPTLAADLTAGLKRLKMAGMRRLAPELLVTAKTQRWNPEEFLRTLVEAEIAARDESNARTRRRQACFPVSKTLEEFDLTASPIPTATFDYLGSLEWIRAAENVCFIGPAGTGKSHLLLALGSAAVDAGHRVRYYSAADLVDTLYRGLADNSVGKVIDGLLRHDLIILDELGFAPLDDTGAQLLFRFVAAAYERPIPRHRIPLAVRILGSVPPRTHHRGQHARPPPPPLPRGHHRRRQLPHETSPSPRRNQDQQPLRNTRRVGTLSWPPTGITTWPLTLGKRVGFTPSRVRIPHPPPL
jgi:DNA replication protein DnaC